MSVQRSPLLTAPIVPTLARLATPGIVLALFQTAVSVADTYYIGQLGYRTYEVYDMYANTLGVLIGWALAFAIPAGLARKLR